MREAGRSRYSKMDTTTIHNTQYKIHKKRKKETRQGRFRKNQICSKLNVAIAYGNSSHLAEKICVVQ